MGETSERCATRDRTRRKGALGLCRPSARRGPDTFLSSSRDRRGHLPMAGSEAFFARLFQLRHVFRVLKTLQHLLILLDRQDDRGRFPLLRNDLEFWKRLHREGLRVFPAGFPFGNTTADNPERRLSARDARECSFRSGDKFRRLSHNVRFSRAHESISCRAKSISLPSLVASRFAWR